MGESRPVMGAGAMWSMLDNLAQQVLSFLVFLFLARIIAPQDFGLVAIAHLVVTLARQTVFDAIVQPVARSHAPTDALYSRAFAVCLLAALAIATVVVSGAGLVAQFYRQSELVPVLCWMSLVVLATGAASAYESRLARSMQFRPLAIRSIVSVAAGGGVGIALAMQGAGVMALVAQQVVTSCLALALLVLQSGWRPR
ncbi:MAG: oligosaccharide flippase family protein, partial [Rhodoferax sp.]|nr:oligosaccharide flippase family protein [Rhodoferax sp.]